MGEHYQGAHGELVVVLGRPTSWPNRPRSAGKPPPPTACAGLRFTGCCRLFGGRRDAARRARAGGGVGSAALALGQRMERRSTSRRGHPAKRAHAIELGAFGAFPSDERFRSGRRGRHRRKPDLGTLDGVLAPGGRLVTCGGTGGGRVEVNLPRLFFGQFEIMGSTMGTFRLVRRAHEARRRWFARPGGQRLPPRRLPARPRPPGGRRPVRQGRPPPPVGAPAPVETAS